MASGVVLDAILAAMLLEGLLLVALYQGWGRGIAPGVLLPNLASGMGLLLAMRLGVSGAWWPWISVSLLGALLAHVLELRRHWR
jgi:hypothetical protein